MLNFDPGSFPVRLTRQSAIRRSLIGLVSVLGAKLVGSPVDDAQAKKRKKKKKKGNNAGPTCAAGEITCPGGSVAPCCPADRVCCNTSRLGCCTPL